jgi:hypothetical protein
MQYPDSLRKHPLTDKLCCDGIAFDVLEVGCVVNVIVEAELIRPQIDVFQPSDSSS